MNLETIHTVLSAKGLPEPAGFTKVDVGFTNTVYSIDDQYILKVCTDQNNETAFKLESQLYKHFRSLLPVPQLITYDESKSIMPNNYMLYHRIDGDNLYNVWHELTNEMRKSLIKQLCAILKTIINTDTADLLRSTSLKQPSSWKEVILDRITKYTEVCQHAGTISDQDVNAIKEFVAKYSHCLDEQRMALVYWDAHFDNVLVKGGTIVGLLDFERTELASIDFTLDIVRRMVNFPKKYMSEYAEQFAKVEDYTHLMDWYKEFYPELFEFKDIERRLDLYSIAHDLEDLENWPQVQSLVDNLKRVSRS